MYCGSGDDGSKVRRLEEMAALVSGLKARGCRVVLTNGCFDILHHGHVRFLAEAKGEGDVLLVAVNSDASVRRIKGEGRPIIPQQERLEVLAALSSVDYVFVFDDDDPAKVIEQLRPDVLVKGSDWPLERIVGRETVEGYGGRVVRVKLVEGISTSQIIQRVGKRSEANRSDKRRGS